MYKQPSYISMYEAALTCQLTHWLDQKVDFSFKPADNTLHTATIKVNRPAQYSTMYAIHADSMWQHKLHETPPAEIISIVD